MGSELEGQNSINYLSLRKGVIQKLNMQKTSQEIAVGQTSKTHIQNPVNGIAFGDDVDVFCLEFS